MADSLERVEAEALVLENRRLSEENEKLKELLREAEKKIVIFISGGEKACTALMREDAGRQLKLKEVASMLVGMMKEMDDIKAENEAQGTKIKEYKEELKKNKEKLKEHKEEIKEYKEELKKYNELLLQRHEKSRNRCQSPSSAARAGKNAKPSSSECTIF